MNYLLTALVAIILIALAFPYRWHRENKRAKRLHNGWMLGHRPFYKAYERREK